MRATNSVVGSVSLHSEASVLAASRSESTSFSVLVDRVDDPVDAWVVSDHNVLRINHDDFEVFVGGILVDPVRVEDAEVSASSAGTFLGNTSKVANKLQLVDTLVLGFTVNNTLVVGSLAATSANGDTVDNISLKIET